MPVSRFLLGSTWLGTALSFGKGPAVLDSPCGQSCAVVLALRTRARLVRPSPDRPAVRGPRRTRCPLWPLSVDRHGLEAWREIRDAPRP